MDERAIERVVTDLEVEAALERRSMKVLLMDLSPQGCLLKTEEERVDVDTHITLKFPLQVEAAGHVVWKRAGHVGVRFENEMHKAVVLHLGFPMDTRPKPALKDSFGRQLPQLTKFL